MKDKTKLVGLVDVVVKRASGDIETMSGQNTIETEIKNAIASGINGAVSGGFGVLISAFDGSNSGFVAGTSGESGIIVKTTANDYYQCSTEAASSGNSGTTMKVVGTVKANASKTIDYAYLGHGWSSNADFAYNVANHSFSSNIALEDGDQLDITWTITIANS
jgi:hypothetical protein